MSAKCLRCGAGSEWLEGTVLKSENPEARSHLSALQELVRHGTERRGEAIVLMYDEEDGFFISTVETGARHYPVKEIDSEVRHATLAKAIEAAVAWHNAQREKWYMSYLKKIKPPTQ